MRVELLGVKGTWREIANSARTTAGKDAGEGEPSSSWKRRMLMCEHSPIRQLELKWKWMSLKTWISTHFVRHHNGIDHWVESQRPDRTGSRENRDETPQGAPVNHECKGNAQAIINISRKRLCGQAMPETRQAWQAFLDSFRDTEPELYSACVPECVYRNGLCPEFNTCAYFRTFEFETALAEYLHGFEHRVTKFDVGPQEHLIRLKEK
jgi:hypothetical protein